MNSRGAQGYFGATSTATWGFIMGLPLLILYEVGIRWVNSDKVGVIHISSDTTMLREALLSLGVAESIIIPGLVVLVGLGILIQERKKNVEIRSQYPAMILLESSIYAVVLAFVVSGITGWLLSSLTVAQVPRESDLATNLVLSLGAGIYEELVFRVLLVGGLFFLLRSVFPAHRILMYIIAAIVGAICFSLIHHLGNMGDPWEFDVFLFRAVFGLMFNIVFLIRGFAVVAWAHAIYDVMIFSGFFSLFQ